jgi:hypothetical protein
MSARDTFDRPGSLPLSRRAFIERAGLLTGGLLVLGPGGLLRASGAQAQVAAQIKSRAFAAGSFMLSLDGKPVGFVQSFEGGTARGEVATMAVGPTAVVKKNIANVHYDPIRFRAPVGSMAPPFWDLLNNTLKGNAQRVSGEIAIADFNGTVQRRLTFSNALVTEMGIPALDAAAKELAYVEVALTPETSRSDEKGGGKVAADLIKGQKKSALANFRLAIDGLDQACKRINKVEALVVKQSVVVDQIGITREPAKQPGKLEFPNLVFTVPMLDAPEFQKWHKEFVIDGLNGDDKERSGSLDLLAPDLATAVLTVKFSNLGIFALAPVAASGDTAASMKAELYCESMSLEVPKSVA